MSTVLTCPVCGAALRVDALGGSGAGGWQRGQDFALGAVPAGAEYSKETPVGKAGIEADVYVPLLQAAICGVVAALLVTIYTVVKDKPWPTPIIAGVIVFAVSWWLLLLDHRKLLRKVETFVGKDLDGDGEVGFSVEITESLADGRKRMKFCEFPAKQRDVERFALAVLNGQLTVHGNHRLSRRTFEQLRDESLSRGLLAWVNPQARNQGVELTRVGEHVFESLLDHSPTA